MPGLANNIVYYIYWAYPIILDITSAGPIQYYHILYMPGPPNNIVYYIYWAHPITMDIPSGGPIQ